MSEKKVIFPKYVLIIICMAAVVSIGVIISMSDSFANVTDSSQDNIDNSFVLECNEYVSLHGELSCKLIARLEANQNVSALSVKLSDTPSEINNLLDSSYDSNIMNADNYIDVLLGENIESLDSSKVVEVAEVVFNDVTDEKLITILEGNFYDDKFQEFSDELALYNPTVASKLSKFEINSKLQAFGTYDNYFYLGEVVSNSINSGEKIPADFDWQNYVEESINDAIASDVFEKNIQGVEYTVSKDNNDLYLNVCDSYSNCKSLNIIYVHTFNQEFTLPFNASETIYTRSYVTVDSIKNNIIETNGYMALENNKINLYGDSSKNLLIDSKNWYYIDSDVYDFSYSAVNIPSEITYEEFMSNITAVGVSIEIYNGSNQKITSGKLDSTNTMKVINVPGYDEDIFTINTLAEEYLTTGNLNVADISPNKYAIHDIEVGTKIENIVSQIDTNGSVKIYNYDGSEASVTDVAKTNMYIEVSFASYRVHYDISVLGDIVGNGEIYLGDVIKLYRIYKEKIEMTYAEKMAGDVVNDNDIDLLDVAKLYRYYRGVENSLK